MTQENKGRGSEVNDRTYLPTDPMRRNHILRQRAAHQRRRRSRIGKLKNTGRLSENYEDERAD